MMFTLTSSGTNLWSHHLWGRSTHTTNRTHQAYKVEDVN